MPTYLVNSGSAGTRKTKKRTPTPGVLGAPPCMTELGTTYQDNTKVERRGHAVEWHSDTYLSSSAAGRSIRSCTQGVLKGARFCFPMPSRVWCRHGDVRSG